jgi:glycosyltransferase involved in cell wall biosynthesis
VKKTRIALIHCGFTYSGGGERLVLEQVRGLRARGYAVDCYAPTIDPDRCFPELMREIKPRSLFPQLPRRFPLRDALQMVAASVFAPLLALTLPRYDLFIGANQPGAWISWVVSRIRRKPYLVYLNQPCRLVYPRDIDLETGWQTKRDYQLLNALIIRAKGFVRWADWASVQGARELLVDGMYIGARIARTYRRQVVDCPAGAQVPGEWHVRGFFEAGDLTIAGTRIFKPYVLLTNRHYPQKRFDLALRAIADLAAQKRPVELVITGGFTGYTPQLMTLAEELGVADLVRFVGEVSEMDLRRLYDDAAVYVYPSPEEDFGLGVVEAMARGVPVVAWRFGGPTVTVRDGETGFLAEPYSVQDYACKIGMLLADPARNRTMGAAAAEHVRATFAWKRHIDRLAAACERVRTEPAPLTVPLPAERRKGRRGYTAVWEKRRLIASLPDVDWILDAGAGGGEYVPYLILRGKRVIAMDLDPVRVRQLQRRFAHVPNVFVVQGSVDALPFADRSMGLVWGSEIVEHLGTIEASLAEFERVSARNVVATLPAPFSPYHYLDKSHVLRYSVGSLSDAIARRKGWRYDLEGFGLCLPQWVGLDRFREAWLAFTRRRPWAAWTLLLRAERVPAGDYPISSSLVGTPTSTSTWPSTTRTG